MTRDKLGVDRNDGIVSKRGLEQSSFPPTDFEFAEFFGGGSEYFPLRQSSLGLVSSIQLLAKEKD